MKRAFIPALVISILGLALFIPSHLRADGDITANSVEDIVPSSSDELAPKEPIEPELQSKPAADTMSGLEELKPAAESVPAVKSSGKKGRHAEAFVVGPDWEFDGFVAGGQDENIKSMFSVHDLIYLNVGTSQGFSSGDIVGIYRRGDKIRDPQTKRMLGFEVRKIAVSEVSDRVSDNSASVRILKSYEAVEVGDLVRREE